MKGSYKYDRSLLKIIYITSTQCEISSIKSETQNTKNKTGFILVATILYSPISSERTIYK